MQRSLPILLATLALTLSLPAAATTIVFDFEAFDHGGVVAPDGAPGVITPLPGFSYEISATNPNRSFDIGAAFDTTRTGTADTDLEHGTGWSAGNLAPSTQLGKILILQENSAGCGVGPCTSPDDEGRRPAGSFRFDPAVGGTGEPAPFQHFAFDLVDVEGAGLENGSITFFLGVDEVVSYSFASFLQLGQAVTYGNNSANRIVLNGIGDYDAFEIALGGSGGIDNVTLSNMPIVPEPATAALVGLGLVALAAAGSGRRGR